MLNNYDKKKLGKGNNQKAFTFTGFKVSMELASL
jgi:hypothetical protein